MNTEEQKDKVLEADRESGENIAQGTDPESGENTAREPDPESGTSPDCGSGKGSGNVPDPEEEREPGKKTLEELELENQRLREEHELLLKEYKASLPLKERMYDRVPLTVKQLDVIIGLLLAALAAVIILGLADR